MTEFTLPLCSLSSSRSCPENTVEQLWGRGASQRSGSRGGERGLRAGGQVSNGSITSH